LLLCGLAAPCTYSDWPRWRGANGDGVSAETAWDPTALSAGPKIVWQTNVGIGFSNVSIQGKYLFTMGSDTSRTFVYCLDAHNGKQVWKDSYECRQGTYGPQATPTVDGGFLFTLSTEGHLHCLDARTGKILWVKHLVKDFRVVRPYYGFAGSPVVEGNLVIVTGNSGGIALQKNTGKMAWTSTPADWRSDEYTDATGSEYSTPVPYTQNGKRYVLIQYSGGLRSSEVTTGNPVWSYEWLHSGPNAADPILFDSKVFISTITDAGCTLLDIGSGKPQVLWQNRNMRNRFSTCVRIGDYLYGCHGDVSIGEGVLRCIDLSTGKIKWQQNLGGPLCLSAADGKLLILTDRGELHIAEASPQGYREIASAQVLERLCWTPPVLSGGRIYCRDGLGNVACLDVSK
jgi:outer membrane protein assembly factor BamB